jgi:hypothetical protein
MDQHVNDMCLMGHLGGLAIVSFLAVMLALPAVAQTNSDSETQGTDTARVRAPSESERGPTSSNPVTQKPTLVLYFVQYEPRVATAGKRRPSPDLLQEGISVLLHKKAF